jgi:transposase
MPRPLPIPVRQLLLRRWQRGQSAERIADDLGLAPRTVRHWLHRFRAQPEADLWPAYRLRPALAPAPLVEAGLQLRREHPTWGAGLIRVQLLRVHGSAAVPSTRTLQRWFGRSGLASAPVGRRPTARRQRASQPHLVWQVDAADQVALRTARQVSWLRVVDECSGAFLWTAVFPPRILESGAAGGRPGVLAASLCPLGATGASARG